MMESFARMNQEMARIRRRETGFLGIFGPILLAGLIWLTLDWRRALISLLIIWLLEMTAIAARSAAHNA